MKNDFGAFDGNKTAGIPPFSLNVRTRYTIPSKVFFEVGVEHLSSYIADDANLVEIPTYTILHASAGYHIIVGSMYLKLIMGISNITNRKYVASAYINPERTSNGYAVYEPGLPRNFYVTISVGL